MKRPWVVAHRGASAECPENTIAAFDRALADGCQAIELDVQLSRDGVPVVFHDWTLAKTGLRSRRLGQLDAAELARLRYRGQRLPSLEAVLSRYGGRVGLLIELKVHERDRASGRHRALAKAVHAAVRAERLEDDVLLLSFDEEALEAAAGFRRLVLNLYAPRRITAAARERVQRWFAVSVDVRTLSTRFADLAHDCGKPVLAWTCNTPARVARAVDCGADAIMADSPAWLASRIR
jgi:glycerophosphoryl diester phosphodiesterase